jgi:hypothetical protein
LKPKTAFESGNSPPKVSENGVPIQTGRGVEEAKRRIMEAFEKIRQHHAEPTRQQARQPAPLPPLPEEKQPHYTETHRERFHQRVTALSLRALSAAPISKSSRNGVFEVAVPTESAEQLIREALGE